MVAHVCETDIEDSGVPDPEVRAPEVCQADIEVAEAGQVEDRRAGAALQQAGDVCEAGAEGRRPEVQRARVVDTRDGVAHIRHTRSQRADVEQARDS